MTENIQNLKTLKHKRGTIKTQITLFQKFIDNFDTSNVNEKDKQNIKLRKEKIEPLYETFEEIQTEIELLELELNQDVSCEGTERESFSNAYFAIVGTANNILNPAVKEIESIVDANSIVQGHYPNSNQTSHNSHMHVKLPTITLPTFDGTFTLWREFYDAFTALIHSNNSLSDVQKLSYLKSSLKNEPVKNEPADLIRSYDTTSENYTIAWTALQKRYDNKRRIITDHVQNLLEIPKINKESHAALRQLINQTENHIQCLKSIKNRMQL
ncbi:Protein of unknown function (DUF1759) [Popillia japonica]|uniref:Uncharacterized protein n=1 Tax=Popillia japonica TaxID=7064 RepID=A0AAW1M1C3_POPJA